MRMLIAVKRILVNSFTIHKYFRFLGNFEFDFFNIIKLN